MRIVTIIGARPQFVKAGVVSASLALSGADEVLVHTGQHYDHAMSRVFFEQLKLKEPDINLGVGSASHAVQTGDIMVALERFILETGPYDWMLVYGDTNSTIAGALVAAKIGLRIAHVEAGLRSFNRRMPEEVNRVVTDALSDILFAPTQTAVDHLKREGVAGRVVLSGDVMLDSTLHYSSLAEQSDLAKRFSESLPDRYVLATVHRAENTDDPERLRAILAAFGRVDETIIFPAHPRTRKLLSAGSVPANVRLIDPVGYLEMLTLVQRSSFVLTDSGGLQKEAYWLEKPCITLRDETEWVETLANDWNQIVGADENRILAAVDKIPPPSTPRPPFGMPMGMRATEVIVEALLHDA